MKFGCFGSCDQIAVIKQAGYDCAELDFCELTDMDEASFEAFKSKALASGLGFEVFSGLLPLSERFHSSEFNLEYWLEHTRKGAKRASELGCNMIPFGAGKCRSIPEDCDKEKAVRWVAQIVRSFSELLEEYHIRLVIEPLGPPNSNFLNTLPEVMEFLKLVNHPNCSSMCDLRHMVKSEESLDNIISYISIIGHAHIDYPEGFDRYFPLPDDGFDYIPYFQALKAADYPGILTVEATAIRNNFEAEAAECCKYLHELINK